MITDKDRLDFIEKLAKFSRTGVSFDWDGKGHYRMMVVHFIGPEKDNVREAIDTAINERKLLGRKTK